MELHLTLDGRRGLSDQLYQKLRAAILEGRLRPGDCLPPTRELAARLDVSRNTVSIAYARLMSEGFLTGRMGSGTFVDESAARATPAQRAPRGADLRPGAAWESIPVPARARPSPEPAYDFRVGMPDARLFPYTTWRRLVARELYPDRMRSARSGDPFGEVELREAIVRHLGVSRSVKAGAEDVVVTSGAQQALDLIARVLVEPGACVAIEDPGYPMARVVFHAQRARIAPVPVDAEGLVVDALPEAARLIYVTPSHQLPLGMPMSLARRLKLLAWAERRKAVVVEDDYDSEYRFGGRALDPLQSLDRNGLVLYVGSFSKVLLPALRLGYVVAPPSLRPALGAAKMVADWYSPLATQAALARFIEEGLLARHVRSARREYEKRRERLEAALARHLAAWLEPVPAAAGLHMSALFSDPGIDAQEVARRARDADVAVEALSIYSMSKAPPSGLALGYGAIAASQIDEGMRRLSACLEGLRRASRRHPGSPRR
jgi:GntR family transcriptional regulator / MocR family aminotransferase